MSDDIKKYGPFLALLLIAIIALNKKELFNEIEEEKEKVEILQVYKPLTNNEINQIIKTTGMGSIARLKMRALLSSILFLFFSLVVINYSYGNVYEILPIKQISDGLQKGLNLAANSYDNLTSGTHSIISNIQTKMQNLYSSYKGPKIPFSNPKGENPKGDQNDDLLKKLNDIKNKDVFGNKEINLDELPTFKPRMTLIDFESDQNTIYLDDEDTEGKITATTIPQPNLNIEFKRRTLTEVSPVLPLNRVFDYVKIFNLFKLSDQEYLLLSPSARGLYSSFRQIYNDILKSFAQHGMRGNFTVMINEINELLKNILSIINKYTVETDHDQEALNVMLYAMGKISDTVKRFGNNHINWMKKILSINLEGDRKQLDLRRNKIRELMNKKRKSLIYLYLTEYKGYAKVLIENYKGISLNEIFEVYNKLNNSEHSALINEIDSFQNILNEELFLIAVLENLGNNMPLSDRIMRYQTKISVYLNILTGIELLTTYIKINEERGEEEFVYYERLARLEKSLEDANNGLDFSDEDQKMFELILNLLWVNENKKNISLRQKKEFKNKIFALLNFNFHI